MNYIHTFAAGDACETPATSPPPAVPASGYPAEPPAMRFATGGGGTAYALRKSGSRPVAFSGRHLGFASGYRAGTPLWHELNIYETDEGHHVADIRVFSKAQGARDQFHVLVADSLEEALQFFEDHDPRADVQADFDLGDPALAPAELMVHAAALKYRIAETVSQYKAVLASFLHQLSHG